MCKFHILLYFLRTYNLYFKEIVKEKTMLKVQTESFLIAS